MEPVATKTTFIVALQTSVILGLLHGLSPCEHSWPILAPFAVGSKNMKRIMRIGTVFCLGTASACIVLGAIFGTLGSIIPASWSIYMGAATSAILIVLGMILILKPHLLHFHDDEHDHDQHGHAHEHNHHHDADDRDHDEIYHADEEQIKKIKFKHGIYWGMFSLGFVNMIAPCPTSAVMYTYALLARSFWHGTAIFFAYAVATTIVLMFMAFLLVKASQLIKRFGREKNEILITRISGALITAFGVYMVLIQFPAFRHFKLSWIL